MTTNVATLSIDFLANTGDAMSGIGQIDNAMQGLAGKVGGSISRMGTGMTQLGMSFAPVAAGLSAIGYAGISAASNFDSAFAEISARTGLTGDALDTMRNQALQLGADTAFSAQQAADAMLQLLSSGQSAEQAMATLPIVLDLAAASGEALGATADTLTDIMAAYGLEVEQAAMVSDALARAAGASSADIASLGQGFANVGGIAAGFGLSVETTAAALAVLAENGIKGAEAGTALKSALLNITRPEQIESMRDMGVNFYDASGNARDFETVIGELSNALSGMSVEEQNTMIQHLAGSYGQVALRALMGEVGIDDMNAAMHRQPGAAQVAAARMNTFAGRIDALKGSVETLMIRAFTPFMNNVLKPLAEMMTEHINTVAEWAQENEDLITKVVAVGGAFVVLTTSLIVLGGVFTATGAAIGFIGTALGFIFSPIGLIIGALALLGLAYTTNFLGFRDAIDSVVGRVKELANAFIIAYDPIGKLNDLWINSLLPALMQVGAFIQANVVPILQQVLPMAMQAISDAWYGVVRPALLALANFWTETLFPALSDMGAFLEKNLPAAMGMVSTFWNDTLKPAFQNIANFWNETLKPPLQNMYDFFAVYIPGAFALAQTAWDSVGKVVFEGIVAGYNDLLKPALDLLYDFFAFQLGFAFGFAKQMYDAHLQPMFEQIVSMYNQHVKPRLSDLQAMFQTVLPIAMQALSDKFAEVKAFIQGTVAPAFATFNTMVLTPIWETIMRISNAAGSLIGTLQGLAGAASGVTGLGGGGGQTAGDAAADVLAGAGNAAAFALSGGLFGNLDGYAAGGNPPANRAVMVGEAGPELFVPPSSGTIVPNHKLGGGGSGGGVVINGPVYISGVQTDSELMDRLLVENNSRGGQRLMTTGG